MVLISQKLLPKINQLLIFQFFVVAKKVKEKKNGFSSFVGENLLILVLGG